MVSCAASVSHTLDYPWGVLNARKVLTTPWYRVRNPGNIPGCLKGLQRNTLRCLQGNTEEYPEE